VSIVKQIVFFISFFLTISAKAQLSISINAPKGLSDTSITRISIEDFKSLLQQSCKCDVGLNNESAPVQISLPAISKEQAAAATVFSGVAKFPYKHFPNHDFEWKQEKRGEQLFLMLTTSS